MKIKRKIDFQGLSIAVETDKGEYRHWTDSSTGEEGKTKMKYPYGYFEDLKELGLDGEKLDVFVGDNKDSKKVFIVHQLKAPLFALIDEDKVFLGFNSKQEVKEAYKEHYNDPRFYGDVDEVSIEEFRGELLKKAIDMITTAGMVNPVEHPAELNLDDPNAIQGILNNFATMDDSGIEELVQLVWGPDYTYSIPLQYAKQELMAFLMDQIESSSDGPTS